MINQDSGTIEHSENGIIFKPLTLADFGHLQNLVNIPAFQKPFIKLQDMIRWCYSANGIDHCLCRSAKIEKKVLLEKFPKDIDRWVLVDKIIDMTMGNSGEASTTEAPAPLAETQKS